MIAEVVGGVVSGSLALLADLGAHADRLCRTGTWFAFRLAGTEAHLRL